SEIGPPWFWTVQEIGTGWPTTTVAGAVALRRARPESRTRSSSPSTPRGRNPRRRGFGDRGADFRARRRLASDMVGAPGFEKADVGRLPSTRVGRRRAPHPPGPTG